jgi:hypothetical protein
LISAFLWFFQPAPLPPGVEIKIEAQPQKAFVGDPIRIELELTVPQDYQFTSPVLDRTAGEFTILEPFADATVFEGEDNTKVRPTPPADERVHYRKRATVAVYKVGEFEFPSLRVTLRDPEGKEAVAATAPLKIQIQSVLNPKEQNLKDLKKQAEIRDPVNWILWLTILLLVIVLALAARWWWRRRRRTDQPVPELPRVDPLAAAEADLRALLMRGWVEKGLIKPFYVDLSDIVKRILDSGCGIQTLERTTGEVMNNLRKRHAGLANRDLELIESLLIHCDLVKFAKYVPSKTEIENAVADAFKILDACKSIRALPAGATSEPLHGVP